MEREALINIPLTDPAEQIAFGNVGSVQYRDTVDGVRYTAHLDLTGAKCWFVKHEDPTGASDGTAVMRSKLYPVANLDALWNEIRGVT